MPSHQFKPGDLVNLQPEWAHMKVSAFVYTVEECLAFDDDVPRYKLKSPDENFSRVALEHMMTASVHA